MSRIWLLTQLGFEISTLSDATSDLWPPNSFDSIFVDKKETYMTSHEYDWKVVQIGRLLDHLNFMTFWHQNNATFKSLPDLTFWPQMSFLAQVWCEISLISSRLMTYNIDLQNLPLSLVWPAPTIPYILVLDLSVFVVSWPYHFISQSGYVYLDYLGLLTIDPFNLALNLLFDLCCCDLTSFSLGISQVPVEEWSLHFKPSFWIHT